MLNGYFLYPAGFNQVFCSEGRQAVNISTTKVHPYSVRRVSFERNLSEAAEYLGVYIVACILGNVVQRSYSRL